MQPDGRGLGIALEQRSDRGVRILQDGGVGAEQCLDRTAVPRVQPGFSALEHGGEAVPPGDVQPRGVGGLGVGGAVVGADRQFDVALQPLQVGHVGDVAEVRLGRRGHRSDDRLAPSLHSIGITGDFVEKPSATGG